MSKKLVSWNVNGLRACVSKGLFQEFMDRENPDVICLQETKLQQGQIKMDLEGYEEYWNYADRRGYSGTAIFTREKPISVTNGLGIDEHDHEGRVITAEYPDYYLVTVYVPNAKEDLSRLEYRQHWEDDFLSYIKKLEEKKPVIYCGDLNVAHNDIDLKNPKSNRGHAGFTDEEREKLEVVLSSDLVDTYRYFYPDKEGAYSWWSYRFHARENNAGWRIDYFIASKALMPQIEDALIYADAYGSDHCPVGIIIK